MVIPLFLLQNLNDVQMQLKAGVTKTELALTIATNKCKWAVARERSV